MQLNNALWILVIGMFAIVLILIFIVVFVITAKIVINKKCDYCVGKIKEMEKEFDLVSKVSSNIEQIKGTLDEVEKLLK